MIGGCIWAIFLNSELYFVIPVFIIFGMGSNSIVCASLSVIVKMIGDNTQTTAFVFGIIVKLFQKSDI